MSSETHTLHFSVDPALKAYLVYLDATGEEFDPGDCDRFVAGFREQVDAEHRDGGEGLGDGY